MTSRKKFSTTNFGKVLLKNSLLPPKTISCKFYDDITLFEKDFTSCGLILNYSDKKKETIIFVSNHGTSLNVH